MRRNSLRCFAVFALLLLCLLYNNTVFAADKYGSFNIVFSAQDEYRYEEGQSEYRLTDIKELYSEDESGTKYYSAKVKYSKTAYDEDEILELIKSSEGFLKASRDEMMNIDSWYDKESDQYMNRQWYLDAIDAYSAWNALDDAPGKDIVVAVIDSGVNYTHKDLSKNMWINEAEANGISGVDDDGNGVEDDIYGACFYSDDKDGNTVNGDPYDTDKDGHGTHVAGIIAMEEGSGGGRGIAYGAKIMAVKTGGSDGRFLVSDVISSVNYAVKMGADIINMSFGSSNQSEVFEALLRNASQKCILVAAAGNDGISSDEEKMYPAAYPFVIGVMASDWDNTIAEWSNYDTRRKNVITYDIAAPGVGIWSTVLNDGYKYMSGTSMAAPVVAASAAIVLGDAISKGIDDPVRYTFAQLINSSGNYVSYEDKTGEVYTYKNVNIFDALTTSPALNISVCDYRYKVGTTGAEFEEDVILKGGNTSIYCGYSVQNVWEAAENVNITATVDSDVCRLIRGEGVIGSIKENETKVITVNDNNAMIFEFAGMPGNTYDIPVRYMITGNLKGDMSVTISEVYEDTIRIRVDEEELQKQAADNFQLQTDNVNAAAASKPGMVKNLKINSIKKSRRNKFSRSTLKWSRVKGAKKYVIYYSAKKKNGFKKLAICSNNKYVHKFKSAKRFYYKVRAYVVCNGRKIYGKYSKTVRG